MKRLVLLPALFVLLVGLTGFSGNDKAEGGNTEITFYATPLVCGAVPEIGCGSRAKPVLLALEKSSAVKEAWLNRPGTVIAVVWTGKPQTGAVAKPVFAENDLECNELSEKDAAVYRKTFRKENLWYRGADVDALSREEATIIAESAMQLAVGKNLITKDEADKIMADIEAYFKEESARVRTIEQVQEDSMNRFAQALYSIAEKHIGSERTAKAMELYQQHSGN